jgi:hypothetical protein
MANYIGAIRSSYFKVKDPKAFKEWFDRMPTQLELWTETDKESDATLYGFGGYDSLPSIRYNEETDEDEDIFFLEGLQEHIDEGWAAIIQEAGREKLRYLIGYVWTVTSEEMEFYDPLALAEESLKETGLKRTLPHY